VVADPAAAVRVSLDVRWCRVRLAPPRTAPAGTADAVTTCGVPGDEPPVLRVELARHGERLGVIECGPKVDGGQPTAADRELLAAVAGRRRWRCTTPTWRPGWWPPPTPSAAGWSATSTTASSSSRSR